TAIAICGVYGPFSDCESFCTRCESGTLVVVEYSSGALSGAMYRLLKPLSVLVCTFMPALTAAARTYGVNEDPTCFPFCVALSHSHLIFAQSFAVMTLPVPLYFHPA